LRELTQHLDVRKRSVLVNLLIYSAMIKQMTTTKNMMIVSFIALTF